MSTTTDNWTEVEATAKRVLGEKVVAFIDQCRGAGRASPASAGRGSPDPAQAVTAGLPGAGGDLRSAVSAGSETHAERDGRGESGGAVRGSPDSCAVRGSPDPAQAVTAGLPGAAGDLRSAVSAGSETHAERDETHAERVETRAERESQLIAVLHKVQAEFGYLAEAHLDAVAQLLRVPAAKVAGVASFYHYFRLSPPGKFVINVCLGTACYVKGADRVAQKLMDELGIAFGETSTDGVFTLEAARCLGTCGLAPVLMVGDDVHPQVTPDQVPLILEKYLSKVRQEGAGQGSGG